MASLSTMRFKDVLVPFPFDDLSGQKVRPAVCLTETIGWQRHVTLAFITSSIPLKLEQSDIFLDPAHPGFSGMGLRVASTLRLHRLITISSSIIRRQLGALPEEICNDVRDRLRRLFAL
jgi:mRNA interferase MazF